MIALFGMVLLSRFVSAQTTPTGNKAQLFQAYFDAQAAEPHTMKRSNSLGPAFDRLMAAIPTMTDAELQQAVSIIDAATDQARITHDGIARMWASLLLFRISITKDGPALMAPEIDRLSALCSDPFMVSSGLSIFISLRSEYPELTVPAMLRAIEATDANSANGRGPAYATILFLYPRKGDLPKELLAYMQRPDLTGQKLLDFLTGIRAALWMPDGSVERLTHYLDDTQPEIRLAALRDLSAASFAERARLKPLLQRLAVDPAQSDALRKLAGEMLVPDKRFSPDPYQ